MTARSVGATDVQVVAAKTQVECQLPDSVWAAGRVACHTDKQTDRKRYPVVVR